MNKFNMIMPNLIKGMHRSLMDVCKDKWCLSILALVFALALNHVVFSIILVNREIARAQFIFGVDTIGTDQYADAGIGQFTLEPLESQVEFSMIDNVRGNLYYGIQVSSGVTNRLAKLDKNTMARVDTLDIENYLIYSGVIDETNGYIYLGIRNLINTDWYRIAKVRTSDLKILAYVDLDPTDGPAVGIPVIDLLNGYAYFMQGGPFDTYVVKIDIDPSRTFERIGVAQTNWPDSLDYPGSSALDPAVGGGYLYVSNAQRIVKFDLATFTYDSKLDFAFGTIHYMAGLDSDLGYLYYQKYSPPELHRVDLTTFTDDTVNIVNLGAFPTVYSMRQNLPIDKSDPANHIAYFGGGYGTNQIAKINLSTFTLVDTLVLPDNIHAFPEGQIDTSYVYFASGTVPSFAIKVNKALFTVDTTYRFPGGYKKFWSGVHDKTNGYLYYAVEGSGTDPYQIIKIDAQTLTFIEGINLGASDTEIRTALIDEANHYAYFVANDVFNPCKIIRVNIDPSNFALAGEIVFSGVNGGHYNEAGVIDNINHYAYIGSGVNDPQKIFRVNTDPLNFAWNSDGTDTLVTGSEGNANAVIDETAGFAYFTDNDTGQGNIIKINLGTFTVAQTKFLGSTYRRMKTILLDKDHGFIYAGQNLDGNLAKINLSDLNVVTSITFPSLYQNVYRAVIDPTIGYAYFFSIAYSSWQNGVIKVDIDPSRTFQVVGSSALSVAPWHALIDTDEAYIYLGSYERDLLKIPYTKKGVINAFEVTLTEEADIIDYFEFYSHTADGSIRLALYDASKNLIWQSDAITNTTSGDWIRVIPSTPITNLPAGDYYLAYQTDSKEPVASYVAGSPGDGFELVYDFAAFPSTIEGETINSDTWSYYGQTTTIATRRAADLDLTQNPPEAPADLTCEALSSDTIRWSFVDQAENETGFKLYGPEGLIWDSGPEIVTDLSYIDETGLKPDTLYEQRYVTAYRGDMESVNSNPARCMTLSEAEAIEAKPALPEGVNVGDLISPDNSSAVYYVNSDHLRQSFPNQDVYLTWFTDFSQVKELPATVVSSIGLGPNVTFRAGTWLVKIKTDPKVYAVEPTGILRWITTGAIAESLYGVDWPSRVMDVGDTNFVDYIRGEDITTAQYPTGSLIQYTNSTTKYYVENGTKRLITPAIFSTNLFQNRFVITGVNSIIFAMPDGQPFPQLEDFVSVTIRRR